MKVKLLPYCHIKCTSEFGYIANLATGASSVFDSNGSLWLSKLSHTPQSVEDIVHNLTMYYVDIDKSELTKDYDDFLRELEANGYVTIYDSSPSIKSLTIELTNRCNERCVHCYLPNQLKSKGDELKIEQIKYLIDQFSGMGGKSVLFTGGEIFLHNALVETICYAHEKRLNISIFSNLIAVRNEHIKMLKTVGVQDIQVSLYGINPEIHDAVTKLSGSCVRTKKSIEKMVDTGLPVRIVCPVLKENWREARHVIQYGRSLGITADIEFNITACEDGSDENLKHRLNIKEMELLLVDLMEYDADFFSSSLLRNRINYDENFNLAQYLNRNYCSAGFEGLYITSNGTITICPNWQSLSLANISEKKLQDIWKKSDILDNIRSIKLKDFPQCVNCEAHDYCVKCFARNYTETNNCMSPPKYTCDLAFLTKRIVEKYSNHRNVQIQ